MSERKDEWGVSMERSKNVPGRERSEADEE